MELNCQLRLHLWQTDSGCFHAWSVTHADQHLYHKRSCGQHKGSPRKGLDNNTIENIMKLNVARVVYISCNPATMVRDLKMMEEKYEIMEVQPVDMFPFTSHVECCAVMELKNSL